MSLLHLKTYYLSEVDDLLVIKMVILTVVLMASKVETIRRKLSE
jgi:hypothetical protein